MAKAKKPTPSRKRKRFTVTVKHGGSVTIPKAVDTAENPPPQPVEEKQ